MRTEAILYNILYKSVKVVGLVMSCQVIVSRLYIKTPNTGRKMVKTVEIRFCVYKRYSIMCCPHDVKLTENL